MPCCSCRTLRKQDRGHYTVACQSGSYLRKPHRPKNKPVGPNPTLYTVLPTYTEPPWVQSLLSEARLCFASQMIQPHQYIQVSISRDVHLKIILPTSKSALISILPTMGYKLHMSYISRVLTLLQYLLPCLHFSYPRESALQTQLNL
jgi:hypothetical protein